MDEREPTGPATVATIGAKCAFFEGLDARMAGAGSAVSPRAAPPPPPALSFEAWAELSVRFDWAPVAELAAALLPRGVSLEAWRQLDGKYRRALSDELRAGQGERGELYAAKYKEERARRGGAPVVAAVAAVGTPRAWPAYLPAPEALQGTVGLPDLPGPVMEAMGRMPFVPPAPEAVAPEKRAAKTVPSKVVLSNGGLTMSLDAEMLQRPTPTLPFAGNAGSEAVLPVRELTAPQYVALRVELRLQVAPREETLRRYLVQTEAAYRVIEEVWGRPARRGELERAVAMFESLLRGMLLG